VSQSEEFKTLPPCKLSKIIAADEIHVDCESQVYNAVLCWVQYDHQSRQQYLKMLLEAVSQTTLLEQLLSWLLPW